MKEVIAIQIWEFLCIYLLLLLILVIMKKCKVDKSKFLITASIKMSVQLALAGFILTYIFDNPHLIFTLAYLFAMIIFTIYRVLKQQQCLYPTICHPDLWHTDGQYHDRCFAWLKNFYRSFERAKIQDRSLKLCRRCC